MRLNDFPDTLDAFLAGRPWIGPPPDGVLLKAAMGRPEVVAGVLGRHAAARLSAVDLAPNASPDGMRIGGDVLLALAASVQLGQASLGPEGITELAAACVRMAEERGLARNLPEDALCSLAAARLRPAPAPDNEEAVTTLHRLSPWSFLDGDLEQLEDDKAQAAGEWLARRALPASRPGRFPLRKLLLRPLVVAAEARDPLPLLAVLARILAPIGADGHALHLVDFYECYCGWMETRGARDADARRVMERLDLRDVESDRRREGTAAAAFFVLLAGLDPAAVRRAPRLHRELLQAARYIASRLSEVTL